MAVAVAIPPRPGSPEPIRLPSQIGPVFVPGIRRAQVDPSQCPEVCQPVRPAGHPGLPKAIPPEIEKGPQPIPVCGTRALPCLGPTDFGDEARYPALDGVPG